MASIYTAELRKATTNKWFFAALFIGCAIAVASYLGSAVQNVGQNKMSLEVIDISYMMLSPLSCFKYWMVTDYLQAATDLFFLLAPLLATLPFAWSFASECKSGSIKNSLTRTSRARYFAAKYLATFLASGLVLVVPIILNLILCACTMPAYMPDIDAVIYVGITTKSMWSEIYYNAPVLYCLMFIGLNFLFAGLWACVVMSLSFVIKNRIALMVSPFLFLLFVKFFEERLFVFSGHAGLTPFSYLRGVAIVFASNEFVILAEFALFVCVIAVLTLANYRKDVL